MTERTSMKDFLGETTIVGDYIFYSTTGRYAESRLCRVRRFTAKTMFVDVIKTNRNFSISENVAVQNAFVRLDQTRARMYMIENGQDPDA